jgi:hypothetical protein
LGFVPPHTSTTTISYQEMPHPIVSREKHEQHASSKPK